MPKQRITHHMMAETVSVEHQESEDGLFKEPRIPDAILTRRYDGGPLADNERLHERPAITMHWDEHRAQIEMTWRIDSLLEFADGYREMREKIAASTGGETETVYMPGETTSFFVDFEDRRELNELIKTARRMRDARFGVDE